MSLTLLAAIGGIGLLPHGHEVPLTKPLDTLPLAFSQWRGVDAPFDSSVMKSVGVDDYLSRVYRGEDGVPIGIYVGYYRSQRTSERLHSPQNCLPGTGWQPLSTGYVQLKNPDGSTVRVNRYIIQKGIDRQIVLYWYESHGRTIANEYEARIDLVIDAMHLNRTDAALVRINTPVSTENADVRAVEFGTAIREQLARIIPR
jgi:EpsI family protein